MQFFLAILSAILLVLLYPRFDLTFLAPAALTPLLYAAAREPRGGKRFLFGWVAGVVYWAGVCYWIQYVLATHAGLNEPTAWLAFGLFSLAKGLHMGAFGWLAGFVMPKWYAIPAVAALWVGVERTHAPLGFAWLTLGDAGTSMSLPLRLAPILGVYGLSYAFAMMSTALALIALRRRRIELLPVVLLLVVFVLPALPPPERGTASAVVVQPNLSEAQNWTTESAEQMRKRQLMLSTQEALQPGAPKPDLILWPEVPAPIYYESDAAFREQVHQLGRLTGSYLLFGTVAHAPSGAPLNSAVMVGPAGRRIDRYDKIFLVPFGEFVPALFSFVNKISSEAGDFAAGSRLVVFPVDSRYVATFICYESAFPHLVRQFAGQGAQLFVNLSNDGYFGDRAAREQHLRLVRMRAAENRRWILRSTNNGITASVDPAGRVREILPSWSEQVGRLSYSYISHRTPYSSGGDWFAWGCLVFGLVSVGVSQLPSYRSQP